MLQHAHAAEATRSHCFTLAALTKEPSADLKEKPQAFLKFAISINKFCDTLLDLEHVKKIALDARSDGFTIWTFSDSPEAETLSKIYAAELDLMDANPNMIFDFAVKFEDASTEPAGFYIIMGR